jgi:hypothetical protein
MAGPFAGEGIVALAVAAADPVLAKRRGQRQHAADFLQGEQAIPLRVQAAQRDRQTGIRFHVRHGPAQWNQRAASSEARCVNAGDKPVGIEPGDGDEGFDGVGADHGMFAETFYEAFVGLAKCRQALLEIVALAFQGRALPGQRAADFDLAAERPAEPGNLRLEPGLVGQGPLEVPIEVAVGQRLVLDDPVFRCQYVAVRQIARGREQSPEKQGAHDRRGQLLGTARQAEVSNLTAGPQDQLPRYEDAVQQGGGGLPDFAKADQAWPVNDIAGYRHLPVYDQPLVGFTLSPPERESTVISAYAPSRFEITWRNRTRYSRHLLM